MSPDFETKSSYSVTVSVDDAGVGGSPDASKDFTLVINDVNEAPTAVSFANATAALDENVTVGTGIKVADIVVADDALGTNVLSLSGADAASFAIRNGHELYYVGASPDFEAKSSYAVTVNVDDAGVGGSPDASKDFTLSINDINEAPTAVSFANAVSIDENVTVGTGIKVADIVVADDALGTNVLSLSGTDAASFAIRNGTELFYVGNSPDFEAKSSYTVTVNVDDASVGGSPDASKDFTLSINDVNEAPTAVSFANAVTALDENVTVGTGIKVADIVVADDALGTDVLSLSGADAASFAIRNGHQLHYIGASPNFEAKQSYSVTVSVDDASVGTSPDASNDFTLTISDVNEAPTAVSFANTTTAIDENITVGTGIKVADIVVTDDALGTDALSLSGTDAASFTIRNGNQLYYTGASPDFEAKSSYHVTVNADDASVGGSPDASQDFTLTVNDVNEAPTAVSFANVASIDENVTVGTGIKVADIVVTDDALGTNVLSLSGTDAASFAIRNGNQLYYVGASPDFEAKSSYHVTVNVDDASVGSTPDASQDFTLTVNDVNEAPTAVSFANVTAALDENVTVGTGIKIADIVVTDDALGTNVLSLSGADASSFTIRNGSQLYYIGNSPDFETKSSYSVTVNVDDASVGTTPDASQTFTLAINNINEAPTAVSFANVSSIDENTTIGTGIKVADIVVTDDALGTNGLNLSGADAASFAIRNGNQLYYIGTSPNFEAKSSYSVTVSVDDPTVGGTPDASQAFTLSINDINEAPTAVSFANATTALDENVTVGTGIKVADIVVTDDALGTNVLSLSGTDAASFAIRNGNQLYYIGTSPNFEAKSSYSVTVSVDDTSVGISPDASKDFTLTIIDVNEAPTAVSFANVTAIDENVTVGTGIKVADILVTDDALGTDVLNLSGTDAASFAIRNGNQLYYVGASPNFEAKSSYHVTVNVDDASVGGSPDASQDFTLAINDKNDPPVVTSGATQSGTVFQGANPVTQGNLILSSGFEAPYWLQGWTVSGSWIGSGTANGAHSGQSAFFANTGAGRTLTLTNNVSTVAGKAYTLDFWLKNDGGTSNDFTVSWNGQVLNALHNIVGNGQYTEYTYTVTGAAGTSQLAYTFHDDTSVWHLDDVTVQETGNRLLNGGFDFGFSDWTATPGGQFDLSLANSGVTSVPSAEFFASSGDGLSTLSQSFATVPGMTYTVSFWVSNVIFNNGPNTFTAKWGGTPLLSLTNAPQQGFTHYSYEVTATGTTTQLSFVSGTNSALYFLDDVSVTRSGESTSGTITFTDEDSADTHTVSATANGSGYIGALTPVLVTDSTGGQTGVVNWTYVVSDVVLADKVAPQTSIQQSYTINIDDHHGGVAPQTVTVTITNPDHAPVITGSTDGSVTESFTQPVPTGNLVANPGFESNTINPQTGAATPNNWTLGGDTSRAQSLGFQHSGSAALQFTFTGGTSFSQTLTTVAGLTYSLDFWTDNAVNLTGVNNTTTVSINGTTIYTLSNVPGDAIYRQYHVDFVASSNSSTLTFNVVNPVSYQAIDDVSVKATGVIPGQESTQGSVSFTDLDLADTHTVTITPAAGGYVGSFTAATTTESSGGSTGTVGWNFTVLDAALAFIPAQQSVTQTYTITVDDGRGGHASRDVHVTLTNPELPPVITGSTNGTVQRDVSLEIPADSIVNGGFEVGLNNFPPDMPGWSFGGARSAFIYGGPDQVHSGNNAVNFFSGTTLSQTVWTVAGRHYTLDFWLANQDLQSRPNDFTVNWNGATVDSYTNVPGSFQAPFIEHSYDLVGTGGPVTLTFTGNNPNGWLIDDVSLKPVGTVTPGTETTSGTVSFTDPEATDTHTVAYSTPVGSSYLGNFAVALGNDSTGGVTGTANWTFSVSDTALAFLAAQQSITQTYTVTVADNHGGKTNRDVTVTLTNPGHAPAVTGSTDGSVSRDTQHVVASGNLIQNGGFDDIFAHWSFGPNGQAQVNQGLGHTSPNVYVSTGDHFLSQTFATTPGVEYQADFWLANYAGTPNSAVVSWNGNTIGTISNLPGSINGAGDQLDYTHYIYTAVATSTQSTLNFAFHGGQFFLDDIAVNSVPNTESTYGTVAFTDVDIIDTHTVSFQPPQGSNYLGTFTASIAAGNDTTGGNPGTVSWTFSVPDSALTGLNAQQSVTQTYTVTIADNHGGSTTRDVSVTLTNPDHAPAVTPASQTGSWIANHSSTTPPGNMLPNGGFETFSYDQNGLPTIFPGWTASGFLFPPQVGVYAHSGGSVVDMATIAGQTGTWSTNVPTIAGVHYKLDFFAAAAFSSNNSIAVNWNGQTVLAYSNVTPLAGHNPTGPGDYTEYSADVVGVAGSSSLVFSLSTGYYWFLDDVTVIPVSSGAITFTDPDTSDTHTVSVAPNSNLGTLSTGLGTDSTGGQTGTVNWNYSVADSAFAYLAAGQSAVETFTVVIKDGHGGQTSQDVAVTVYGVNDAPTLTNPIADQRAALNAPLSFQLPANTFHDVDTGDTLTYSATLADGSALPAWLHFDPATRSFGGSASPSDPSISVKVTATDSGGLSVSDTFAIKVDQPAVFGPGLVRALGIVSSTANGTVGNADSGYYAGTPQFTANGRGVIFHGNASNLVPNDNNATFGETDVFLKNLDTGAITLLSTDQNGNQIQGYSYGGTISTDGHWLAFTTSAQLVSADTNSFLDIYLKNLDTGALTLVSHSAGGGASNISATPNNTSSNISVISADGHYVYFFSDANNLVAGDSGTGTDLFRFDRTTGSITLVSATAALGHNNVYSQQYLSISADGRYVSYDIADSNNLPVNYVLDTQTGTLTQISDYAYGGASLSADGHYVAYMRNFQVYRMDLSDPNHPETLVSVDLNGNTAVLGAANPRISPNGRYIVFDSSDGNLVTGDTNAVGSNYGYDYFVRDMVTGVTTRVTVGANGQQMFDNNIGFANVTDDGSVVFVSADGNLVAGDTNNTWDVFATNMTLAGGSGDTGAVSEVVGVPAAGAQLSTGSSFSFSDADPTDAHHLVSATGSFNAAASSNAPGALGTLTASITHDTVNGAGGVLSWTYTVDAASIEYLAPGQTRVEAFDVSVADDLGAVGTKTIRVTLTGVNDPPVVANPIPDQPGTTDSPFSFQFAANTFTDADNDALTYTATLADGSARPAWLNFDPVTRTFSGTPHFGDGRIDVKVSASDGQYSTSDTFTILLPVFNKAPILAALPGPGQVLTKAQSTDISSTANAMVLDGHLGLGADPNIALATTIPHVSIAATGGGTLDYYKFTVVAGARGIFDIDGGYDSVIDLIDSNGNLVTWNDDSLVTDGAGGSPLNASPNTTFDSFLDYTFATGGTYYLVVGGYNGGSSTPANITLGQLYQLQVSLSSVDLGPKLDPYVINGGAPSGAVGTRVSALVDLPGNGGHDNVTDPDANGLTGIALSGADTSHGTWWFSLDNGASWNPVGVVDEQHALLLAADANTRLYFQANGGVVGTVANAITFHAWDQSSGTAGQTADASLNGGAYAFSTATDTLSIRNIDLAPTDIAWGGVSPASGSAFPGAGVTIANLQAIDPDDSSGFTHTLTGSSSNFSVSSGGAVSKGSAFSNSTTYTLDVQAADSSGLTVTKHFTIITGATGNETLTGTSGDDIFYGRQGDDTISGGTGNDTLFGQDGNDTLRGGAGNDVIDGGAGTDSLDLSDATSAVTFTLTQSASDTVVDLTAYGLGVDTYRNMEGVIGSAFADTLTGSSGNDVLNGGLGADTLIGGAGNDVLIADQSDVLLDGGANTDTLQVGNFTSSSDGQIVNIENVSLVGNGVSLNLSNQTEGFTITGTSGADTIVAGSGDDTINYTIGSGADTIDGAIRRSATRSRSSERPATIRRLWSSPVA